MGMAQIYGLADPETGEIRYIGKANDARKRLASHMRDSTRRDTPVYRWIRKHGKPSLVILIEASRDWRADERRLIAEARRRGDRLLNIADGGDEPFCPHEVRVANAKKVTVLRPAGVMRAYRTMESNIRFCERHGRHSVAERLQLKLDDFHGVIDRARAEGWLDAVNYALIRYFEGEKHGGAKGEQVLGS